MKSRHLTPEEQALWQETNRLTATKQPAAAIPNPPKEAPAPEKIRRPATSPLAPLPTREATRLFKQHAIDATLDLHGFTKLMAYDQVQQFIAKQHRAHRRHVTIITGKGKGGEMGVLRSNLPHWLNEPPLRGLISAFAHARPEKGGTGVMHVLLKRGEH